MGDDKDSFRIYETQTKILQIKKRQMIQQDNPTRKWTKDILQKREAKWPLGP